MGGVRKFAQNIGARFVSTPTIRQEEFARPTQERVDSAKKKLPDYVLPTTLEELREELTDLATTQWDNLTDGLKTDYLLNNLTHETIDSETKNQLDSVFMTANFKLRHKIVLVKNAIYDIQTEKK